MDPDASGIENIRSRGRFLGLSRKRVDEQIDDIAEFTELGDFLYLPLRTYSAGMQIRLSFGIATALESDILIMDEWIGAGDQSFRDKAQARLGALVDRSSILLVATHSIPLSRRLCNKALWLDRGTVCAFRRDGSYLAIVLSGTLWETAAVVLAVRGEECPSLAPAAPSSPLPSPAAPRR